MSGHAYAAEAMPAAARRASPAARSIGRAGRRRAVPGGARPHVGRGRAGAGGAGRDAMALHDFVVLSRPRVDTVANALLHLLEPAPSRLAGVALVASALVRKRPRVGAGGRARDGARAAHRRGAQAAARPSPPADEHALRRRRLLAERPLDRGPRARRCAPCSSPPSACARSSAGSAPRSRWPSAARC